MGRRAPAGLIVRFVPTFPRGYSSAGLFEKHARMAKREARGVNTAPGRVTWVQEPVDLRGIPAIGRGWAGGAIRGTRPGDNLR
jgi:hypothetical protein